MYFVKLNNLKKMKKVLFFLLMCFMVSCSQDDLSINDPGEDIQSSADSRKLKFAGDGKYDVLGCGYDVTGQYMHHTSNRFPVVDVDALFKALPKLYFEEGSFESVPEIYGGATAEDFMEDIKTKNKIGTNSGFTLGALSLSGNLSATVDLNQKYTYSTKYSFARAELVKRVKRMVLRGNINEITPYLDPVFVKDLKAKSPEQIIADYGTHVLCDISIGARLQLDYRSVIAAETIRYEKKLIVEAGAEFSFGLIKAGGSQNHDFSKDTERSKKNASWNLILKSYGNKQSGIGDLKFSNEDIPKEIPFNLSKWEETAVAEGACLTEINWDKSIPIYEFVIDATKKAQIKAAVQKYIEGKKVNLMNLVPLYSFYNSNNDDNILTHDQTFIARCGYYGYHYSGVECYIYGTKVSGSNSLRQYYHKAIDDHLVTSDESFLTNCIKYGYVQEQLLGYVSPSKSSNEMIPLRTYYRSSTGNHYTTTDNSWHNIYNLHNYVWERTEGYVFPVK